ncbi:14.7 kDa ribonuclease H-like protein [Carya illinoinensis]|uniref:14.7 kDa ribonuclease H-like protein n=1 Tax=Carya illinoinensis TaxID=32201 RepID=UPI001C7185DD|nr:14.7 kDa ribonuclease H-like protein [Carya illinoinensis]
MVRSEKLERGYVKVNWDASMDLKGKRMGIGIMIRDEQGEAMVTVCDQKPNVIEATVAESIALRKAAEICAELNIQRATFEGDAKIVILVVNGDEDACFNFSPIVEDIRFYFSSRPNWSIQFVPRAKNMAAHSLAKKAIVMEEERVWIEEVLEFIVGVLNSDKDVIQKV